VASLVPELSDTIFDALNDALPDDDFQWVWRVDVFEGWGGALFVTVYSEISRRAAGAALTENTYAAVGPGPGWAPSRCPDHLGNLRQWGGPSDGPQFARTRLSGAPSAPTTRRPKRSPPLEKTIVTKPSMGLASRRPAVMISANSAGTYPT